MLLSIKTSTGKTITVEAPKNVKTEVRYKQGVVFAVFYDKDTENQIIEMEESIQDIKIQEAQQAPLRESEEVTGNSTTVGASDTIRNEEKPVLPETPAKSLTVKTAASDANESVNTKIQAKKFVAEDPISVEASEMIKNLSIKVPETQYIYEKLQIFIEYLGRTLTFDTATCDTIAIVKAKIQEKEGIPPQMQKLYYNKTHCVDRKTLSDYNIKNGSTLRLESPLKKIKDYQETQLRKSEEVTGNSINIEESDTIRNEEKQIVVEASAKTFAPETSASDILSSVSTKIQEKKVVHPNSLKFALVGTSSRPSFYIQRVPVDQGSVVLVKTSTGKTIPISVKKTDTVENMKFKVYEVEGIPPYQQRLIFNGSELMDYRTVAQCGLYQGASLNLVRCYA